MERGTDIARAVAVLRRGGLVAFPTETVYGLGADASRDDAVAQIFAVKGRPRAHPLIVHLAEGARLDDWATEIPDVARRLAAAAWPGPLTIILQAGHARRARDDRRRRHRRACACPRIRWRRRCCARSAVGSPRRARIGSARSARRPPITSSRISATTSTTCSTAGRARSASSRRSSTCREAARCCCVRAGCARAAIEAVTGPLAGADVAAPAAPGTLASHYAPRAQVIAVALADVPRAVAAARGRVAVLAPASALRRMARARARSRHRLPDDVAGMARELYAALRDLDAAGVDVVIAALPPAAGLGEAVGDRLLPRSRTAKERDMTNPRVGIIMGSQSDWATMKHASDVLTELGVAARGQGRVRAPHAGSAVRLRGERRGPRALGDHRGRRRRGAPAGHARGEDPAARARRAGAEQGAQRASIRCSRSCRCRRGSRSARSRSARPAPPTRGCSRRRSSRSTIRRSPASSTRTARRRPTASSRRSSRREPRRVDARARRSACSAAVSSAACWRVTARQMGYRIIVLDPSPRCPTAQVSDGVVVGALDDLEAAKHLASQVDVITLDTEHVPAEVLDELEMIAPVRPGASVLRTIQDRLVQKQFLDRLGMPQAAWAPVGDATELDARAREGRAPRDRQGPARRLRRQGPGPDRAATRMPSPQLARAARPAGGRRGGRPVHARDLRGPRARPERRDPDLPDRRERPSPPHPAHHARARADAGGAAQAGRGDRRDGRRGARSRRRDGGRDVRARPTARCSSTRSRRARTTAATTRTARARRRSSSSTCVRSAGCRSAIRAR